MKKNRGSKIFRISLTVAILLAALACTAALKNSTYTSIPEQKVSDVSPEASDTNISTEEKEELQLNFPENGEVSTQIYDKLPPPPEITINLCAIGDVMAHEGNINSARRGSTYDFSAMLEEIAPYTADADYVVGNLETTFAGADRTYSGYPTFNTPEQLGQALKNVLGVDLLSTANNHSLDKSYSGLVSTLDFLDQYGIDHVGTYRTAEEQKTPFITEINGVKVAFISYTYGSNNYIPSKQSYCLNVIDKESIKAEAQAAKDAGAEYIIALLHWGVEYQRYASSSQRSLAEWIFENTYTDLIIGNHAHVVQPIEEFNVEFNGQAKKGIVFYALGNFTCSQTKDYRNTGIIANIKIIINREDTSKNRIESISYTPTFIDPNSLSTGKRYRVVALNKAIADYENESDPLLTKAEYQLIKKYKEGYAELLQTYPYITEFEEIITP